MPSYQTLKVFDLAQAPAALQEADELALLRPEDPFDEAGVLQIRVSRFGLFDAGNAETQTVSHTEHRLYRWLMENECVDGEDVLLTWIGKPGGARPNKGPLPGLTDFDPRPGSVLEMFRSL